MNMLLQEDSSIYFPIPECDLVPQLTIAKVEDPSSEKLIYRQGSLIDSKVHKWVLGPEFLIINLSTKQRPRSELLSFIYQRKDPRDLYQGSRALTSCIQCIIELLTWWQLLGNRSSSPALVSPRCCSGKHCAAHRFHSSFSNGTALSHSVLRDTGCASLLKAWTR